MRPLPRLILRNWAARPGRTLLAIGGVALGVAVLLAVRVANYSAIEAFTRTLEMVAGRADIEIFAEGEAGMDPSIFPPFTRMNGIAAATPAFMMRGHAGQSRRGIRLMGVDLARDSRVRPWYRAELEPGQDPLTLFTTPNGALITPALADELGLRRGDRFPIYHAAQVDTLVLMGLLAGEDVSQARSRDLVVMDLPRAWELTGNRRVIHRIDLILEPGIPVADALADLRTWLPAGVTAEASGWQRPQARKMLASFRLNLTALAFVALLVAGFLVFQTVSTTALERRRSAGVLRSVGASRRFVRDLFLTEGAALGLTGGLLGIPLGLLLARVAVILVSQSVSSIYLLEGTHQVWIPTEAVITSFLLGLGVSLLSVAPVAAEASRVPPRESLARQTLEGKLNPRRLALFGALMLAVGGVLTKWPLQPIPVLSGYAAAMLLVFGMALATPWTLGVLYRIIIAVGGKKLGSGVRLALGVLVRSRHRITPAVAGLATAVAMWLSVDMMVRSFRDTVDNWMQSTITADLIVMAGGSFNVGKRDLLPLDVFFDIRNAPGIADADLFKSVRLPIEGLPTTVAMVDAGSVGRQERLSYLEKVHGGQPTDALTAGEEACLISEPLAFRSHLNVGDTLRFIGPIGSEALAIEGVYYDYSSDAGLVLVDRSWYLKRWPEPSIESVAVYLPKGMSLTEGRRIIEQAVPPKYTIEIFSNRDLRRGVLAVFDNTFAITYALEAVAVMVALLAVSGGMTTLVQERRRELAILRAVGGSRRQILRRVLAEAGLIGFSGWLLGAVLGAALSVVLTYVVNRYSFGWSLHLKLPGGTFALSGVLMIAAALLAGALPARNASRISVAEGVRVDSE
ncbi:MAG: FtsX-like permease family protein [bacterium]